MSPFSATWASASMAAARTRPSECCRRVRGTWARTWRRSVRAERADAQAEPERGRQGGPEQDGDIAAPWGCEQRNCPHFRGLLGEPAEWCPTHTQTRPRGSLGGCDLRNCCHLRGLLGGPAEWCPTHTQTRPRGSRSSEKYAQLVPTSAWDGAPTFSLEERGAPCSEACNSHIDLSLSSFSSSSSSDPRW